jgi:hypothetical protein
MNESYRRIGNVAARVYAVLVFLLGLAFAFFAYLLLNTMHVSEAAPVPLIPASVLVVLSIFIWRGATWAMILVAALALGFVFVARGDPNFVALLAVPAGFAALTATYIGCRAKSSAA